MKILVGMSGGVDSTYAALKLMREGHSVEGAVLVMHEYTETDAARIAASDIGIPLHTVDCREAFDGAVREYFVGEYLKGRTPNPCVVCNSEVKFRYLLDYALEHGFDAIATGHYARIVKVGEGENVRFAVACARDAKKDQSYMLWRLPQDVLSRLMLPLSDMTKEEIREESSAYGISASKKSDSQEICFIPDGDYASYIEAKAGESERGSFVDCEGTVLGKHKGIIRYTVGQRKGLGISLGERMFVSRISAEDNTVTLSVTPPLTERVTVSGLCFSGMGEPESPLSRRVTVKLRYLAARVGALATFDGKSKLHLSLDAPQKSVTPGQSAVIYDGDTVLVGGFIN